MRKIQIFIVSIVFIFCGLSPVQAITLETGESAIFSFDFSSEALGVPYNGYLFNIDYSAHLDDDTYWQYKVGITDSTGNWSNLFFMLNKSEYETDTWTKEVVGLPETYFTNDSTQIMTITVNEGIIEFGSVSLQMAKVTDNNENLWTELIEGQSAVPEPTTIILFGIGLLGLAGISRRKS